jgi:hypothetical protein
MSLSSSNEAMKAHHDVTQSMNGITTAVVCRIMTISSIAGSRFDRMEQNTHNKDVSDGLSE